MNDRVGQRLGNYRLVRLLGQGGFADVYLGEHIYLETEAAIKVLHTQLAGGDIEQFRIEARTIARLVHPHIVRVLEFGVEGSTPFLVMDYAPNGTLRQRHPKGERLPLFTVVDYVKQVAPALQYAHDQKLIHRDVKPENLLVGRSGDILLSDFGIALVAQSSRYQSTRDMAGTIAYMAPEQIEAHPRPVSDQYSLAVVPYEWLSGDRPFHGSFTEIAVKQSVVPPPPLREKVPELSPIVEEVVLTALAKDPKQRFATVQAFANALERARQASLDETVLPNRTSRATTVTNAPSQSRQIAPTVPASLPPTEQVTPPPRELVTPPYRPVIPPDTVISSSQPGPQTSTTTTPAFTINPAITRINLVPLGLCAFAVTNIALGAVNAGFISGIGIFSGLSLLLECGGLIQIITGVQALMTGDTFDATALCSYGAFWLALGFTIWQGLVPSTTALGFFLLGWTIFTGLMLLGALRSNGIIIALFVAFLLTFLALTIGFLGAGPGLIQIGGWLGILTALITVVAAWYTATHRSEASTVKAHPVLLGLSAFALTIFVLSSVNAGLIPGAGAAKIVIGLALFYGGLVQLIAGVQALRTRNTFGATLFCSQGALWLIFGYALWQHMITSEAVVSVFLIAWAIFACLTLIVSLRTNVAFIAVSFVTLLTFLALTLGSLGGGFTWSQIGGWLGIITAILAWYAALAGLLSSGKSAFTLPVWPRG